MGQRSCFEFSSSSVETSRFPKNPLFYKVYQTLLNLIKIISIYTLSDLGVLSNLIGPAISG